MKRNISRLVKVMIPAVITLPMLMASALSAAEQVLYSGTFKAISPSIGVNGSVDIIRDDKGRDYIELVDFSFRDGVVLDLKICGDIDDGYPFENLCVSIAEPPYHTARKRFAIGSSSFIRYKKILIFDLDLAENLAMAKLDAPLPVVLPIEDAD